MKTSRLLVSAFLIAVFAMPGFPCIPISLTVMELYKESDLVCILSVEKTEIVHNQKYAVATIQEVWKGEPLKTIRFPIYPPFCGIGEVEIGDHGLTFLRKQNDHFVLTNGEHPYTYRGHVAYIGKDRTVYYEFSEYDLMTEEQVDQLSRAEIDKHQRTFKRFTFPEFRAYLAKELIK